MGDELGVWLTHCTSGPRSRVGFRSPVQAAGLRSVRVLAVEGVPASFREAAVFWETRQSSNLSTRSYPCCGQREGVARNLIPCAVPHPCDSCQSKTVLRICEECLTGCTAYFSEKSRLDLVLSASFSRMRQVIGIVKERASMPLSQHQVWFAVGMIARKEGNTRLPCRNRDEKRHGLVGRSQQQEGNKHNNGRVIHPTRPPKRRHWRCVLWERPAVFPYALHADGPIASRPQLLWTTLCTRRRTRQQWQIQRIG